MEKISLHAYNREIESLTENGQIEEAIFHCRHILSAYPKHVDTYRLLGKAYLESQRLGDAADIFQRVLSTMPDDFISQLGMSIIREDEGNLDEAIWHMENAFEMQPANTTIQDELRRLYGRRDGAEPAKVRLTRGALARMYCRGELYQQAIGELHAALAEDPNRLDLQLLLARVHAQIGQKVEAADAAGAILRKIPFCLEANRIMWEVLSGSEHAEEAEKYHQQLVALDPYYAFTTKDASSIQKVPDQAVTMEKLDWKSMQMSGVAPAQPDWAASLGISLAMKEELSPEKEGMPDWLASSEDTPMTPVRGTEQERPVTQTPFETPSPAPEAPAEAATPTSDDMLPDWLVAGGWTTAKEEPVTEGSASVPEELAGSETTHTFAETSEWSTESIEPAESEAILADDLPDWLKDVGTMPAETPEKQEAAGLPDWLQEAAPQEAAEPAEMAPASSELPDWLQEATPQEAAAPTEFAPAPSELPDWLQEAAPQEAAEPAEMAPVSSELPDWLQEATPQEAAAPSEMAPASSELPDWLQEAALPEAVEPSEMAPTSSELPDWLQESAPPEADETSEPEAVSTEIPDWLKESAPQETTAPEEISAISAELPDWLQEAAPPEVVEPSEPEAVSTEIPDWLQESASQETAVPEETSALSAEIPDWLQEITPKEAAIPDELPTVPDESTPEWLLETNEASENVQGEGETPSTPVLTPEDNEAAFAWLESLAVKQGANEALLLNEEERTDTPPEWVQEAMETSRANIPEIEEPSIPILQEAQVEEAMVSQPLDEMESETSAGAETAPAPAVEPEPAAPISESSEQESAAEALAQIPDLDAGFAWLESLAVDQGAKEALLLTPEERLAQPPDWVKETAAEAREEEAFATPSEQTEPAVPEVEESEAPLAEVQAEGTIPELPDWLAETGKETDEAEEWTPSPDSIPPAPSKRLDINKASLAELERLSGVGFILAQEIVNYREEHGPFNSSDDLLEVEGFSQSTLSELKDSLFIEAPLPASAAQRSVEKPQIDLIAARNALIEGKTEAALEKYNGLILSQQFLTDVIHDLHEAISRSPTDIMIWQSLGDAFLRNDQLEEAMQAYSKAEELLG